LDNAVRMKLVDMRILNIYVYLNYVIHFRWYRIDNACSDLTSLSLKHWPRYEFCKGESNICPAKGMTEIIHQLYGQRQAEISLNTTVCG